MEINLTNKCRVCLSDEQEMHYIFNEFDQGITLKEILTNTTTFEIEQNDGFSPFLCQNCTTIIVEFYNLKTVYKENERQIKTLLSNLESSFNVAKVEQDPDKVLEDATDPLASQEDNDMQISEEDDYITIKIESNCDSDEEDESESRDFGESIHQSDLIQQEVNNFTIDDKEEECVYEQVSTYKCPECGDSFLYSNDIKAHLASNHEFTEEFDYELLSEVSLIKVKKIESNALCSNKGKQSVQTIKEYREQGHKKNVCDICGVGFMKKSYLKDHQEIHCNEKRHVCNYCNKAFKRRTVLVKHKRIHTHPRQCICEVCGKAFNDKGTLKTHIMLVHVKERNYVCLLCGVKFPLKATLEKHIKRHQNKEREYFCTQCPLAYKDKSSLDRHIFIKHSGQNVKSTCGECGKQYTTIGSLMKHQRVCHAPSSDADTLTETIIVQ